MVVKVNGGVVTDQMLSGSLKHFKMTGADGNFGYVVSDGTITLNSSTKGDNPNVTYYKLVDDGKPVPNSSVDLAFRMITEKCTVVQIGLVGDPEVTEVHFALENSSIGWIDSNGDIDVLAMQNAVRSLGSVTVPTTHAGAPGDNTVAPATEVIDLSAVTITQVDYVLD